MIFRLTGKKPFNTKKLNAVLNENKNFKFNRDDTSLSFLSENGIY